MSCLSSFSHSLRCRSGYDNVLIYQYLTVRLKELGQVPRISKRGNRVTSIATKCGVEFRDIARLLAPSTSLRKFGQLFGLEQAKAHFPFAYLTSVERLKDASLPSDDSYWRSELSGERVSVAQLAEIKREAGDMWRALNCKCVGDYLGGYLHLDIEILYEGVQRWNRSLEQVLDLNFVELGRFTISSLSYTAGQKDLEKRLCVGSFFPNNSQMYSVLRRGMRG